MKIYPDELDFKDPKERELAHEQRLQQLKERMDYIKRRNKSYLKGQYGKRLYYDKTKCDDLDDELDDNDEDEIKRPVKCVFTKNLRRDKLFHYLSSLFSAGVPSCLIAFACRSFCSAIPCTIALILAENRSCGLSKYLLDICLLKLSFAH